MKEATKGSQKGTSSIQNGINSGLTALFRLKTVDYSTVHETQLRRCLSTFDLTALGIGSTLGVGIYVVAGQVAKEHSGPSVVLSFLIAAIASIFAGACYAEFGARVPKTGSAYLYTYITVGELLAFVIGWNLILEYVIGTASVASGCSSYIDSLFNHQIRDYFNSTIPIHSSFFGPYPDFLAFSLTLILTLLLAIGVKESTVFNNIFTSLNMLNVMFAVIYGAFAADPANWKLPPHTTVDPATGETTTDKGGFMPFGFSEMLAGASTCFYAFIGFDAIATTGEEVRNPQKAIPISIITSLLSCCAAYCSVSIVLTLMVPYYDMDDSAPLPMAFEQVGFMVARWIVSIGAIAGLSTSLLGAMFPLPRILYAMASDGLIFRFLANINERFKTPFIATILSGLFAATMALLFALDALVDMMSIGTLLAFTLVACCVLQLRYTVDSTPAGVLKRHSEHSDVHENILDKRGNPYKRPTKRTQHIVGYSICLIVFFSLLMGLAVMILGLNVVPPSQSNYLWILFGVGAVGVVACVVVVYRQPQSQHACTFKVPFLPIVAALSISINIILMLKLSFLTWIRFAVWMAVGFIIYFGYGIWHSSERKKEDTISETTPLISASSTSDGLAVDGITYCT